MLTAADLARASAIDREADLRARVDALVSEFPPATTAPEVVWGAQYDAGLAWGDFPVGLGGLGLGDADRDLLDDLLREVDLPRTEARNLVGIWNVAPALVAYATAEQCNRYLRPMFTCEEIWCQLFSEPGAGSDLAALSTRAERDGETWVINGQKVWTSLAHRAQKGILLARTDPAVPKHAGITYFVLDMDASGVEVRPLRQITGAAEYNEVFLDNVVIADSERIGVVNDGWAVALATLASERRVGQLLLRQGGKQSPMARALDLWRDADPSLKTAARRDRITQLFIQSEVLRLTTMRSDAVEGGGDSSGVSVGHLARGPLRQKVAELCMELRGPAAGLIDSYEMTRPDHFTQISGERESGDLTKAFLGTRSLTIAGGSLEISKNVLSERFLGLPREPRTDRGVPWNQSKSPRADGE